MRSGKERKARRLVRRAQENAARQELLKGRKGDEKIWTKWLKEIHENQSPVAPGHVEVAPRLVHDMEAQKVMSVMSDLKGGN